MHSKGPFRSSVSLVLVAALALPLRPLFALEPARPAFGAVALTALDVQEAPQTTVITVRGNAAPTFTTFRLDKPPRLFVDVAGASVQALTEPHYVGNGVIRTVEAVPFRRANANYGRIIVTFDVDALYHVRADGTSVVIVVDGSDRKLSPAQTAQVAAAQEAAHTAAERERQLLEQLRSSRTREQEATDAQKQAQAAERKLQEGLAKARTELAEVQKRAAEATSAERAKLEAAAAERTRQLQGEIEALDKRSRTAEEAVESANKRLREEQEAGSRLREELDKERASLAAVVAQRQSEEARVELLRQRITTLQKDTEKRDNAQIARLQADLDKARDQAEALREEVRRASESRRTAQAEEVAHLKEVLAAKDGELKAAQARSGAADKAKADKLRTELAATRGKLGSMQAALDKARTADSEREAAEKKWRQAELRAIASEQALKAREKELQQSRAEVADLTVQKQKAAEKAEQVARLLGEREREVEAVRAALQQREAALAAEVVAAKAREAEAQKLGRKAEAQEAAKERGELEQKQRGLQVELAARAQELQAARSEAERNAAARLQAEREADKLRAVVAEREKSLQALQASKDSSSQQQLAAAEQRVAAARQQLASQMAQRDSQLAKMEADATARLAQARAELQKSSAELEKSRAQVADLTLQKQQADSRAEEVARLLSEREREVEAVRAALQQRETALADELAKAKAREIEAQKAGRKSEAQEAAQERDTLEKKQHELRADLKARAEELKAARQDAEHNAQARRDAEKVADGLRAQVAQREKDLAELRKSKDAGADSQVKAAQKKLETARAQLGAQLAERDQQMQRMASEQTARLSQIRSELAAVREEAAKARGEAALAARELVKAKEQQAAEEKRADAAAKRAEEATAQLKHREEELDGLKVALQDRESKLAAEQRAAVAAEQKAQKEGKVAAVQAARAERERVETAQAALRQELQSQRDALQEARDEAKAQAQARQKAEQEARLLQKALAERQKELRALETGRSSEQELAKAQRSVTEARAKLEQQKAADALRAQAQQAQFDSRVAKMRSELQLAHERELTRVRAERDTRAREAQTRAARVEGLLKDRESELKRLQDELRVREMTLAGQLDEARTREAEAAAAGRADEAKRAAAERRDIEGAIGKLQADLKTREQALTSATREVQQQAEARKQAQAEVERLSRALQEREAALQAARSTQDASGEEAHKAIAQAEAQVAQARKQHADALATRDAEIRKLERDTETRIAQVREALAAEHKKREEALSRSYEQQIAQKDAQRQASDLAASEQKARMADLLGQRDKELRDLKGQLQGKIDALAGAQAAAKAREAAAAGAGRSAEAAAAQKERKRLEREAAEARKAMRDRDQAIAAAKAEAASEQKARQDIERKAQALAQTLDARAAELAQLKSGTQSSSQKVQAAEKAVAEARAKVDAAEKAQTQQQQRMQDKLERDIAEVRKQMQAEAEARESALKDRYAAREKELESALQAEQSRRKQAEQAAQKPGSMDDYLRKQQARIAVLESRAERERQSRDEGDKAAEKERDRAEKLAAELDKAKRAAQKAEADAQKAQAAQSEKQKAQQSELEGRLQRREADLERARARAQRTPEVASNEPAQVGDIAITAEGRRKGHIELPIIGQAADARYDILSRTEQRIMLRLVGVRLPERLQRAYDTRNLQGPVERVTAFAPEGTKDELRLVVDLSDRASDRITLKDGRLVWDFERADVNASASAVASAAPVQKSGNWSGVRSGGAETSPAPQPLAAPAGEESTGGGGAQVGSETDGSGVNANPIKTPWRKARRYTGKRINLTIKDADIQHVLTFLAKEGKVNIIAGPEVTGAVTFHLENIPWDLALDVILRARGLDYVRQSGVIRVSTIDALKKEFDTEVDRRQKLEEVKQLVVRIIPINYATAADMVKQVGDILSKKGTVTIDARTNSMIVKDTEEHVAAVEEMVRKLDGQTPQVLIEARVVEAATNFNRDVGIQWGGSFAASSVYGNETGLAFPSVVGVAGGADGGGTAGQGVKISVPNYAVNMPAPTGPGSGGAIGLTLGSLGGAANLNLRLSAAENEGVVKIVSSPKVLTLDHTTATIRQGISVPISVVSAAGVSTRFFNADLKLSATPHITQDGNIKLSVNITKMEPDFSNRAADGNPTIQQREASTELLLGDGETTVIGGIYTRNTAENIKKVPFLADIPFLGVLFRAKSIIDKRTELLIFITPRIVNRAAAISVGK